MQRGIAYMDEGCRYGLWTTCQLGTCWRCALRVYSLRHIGARSSIGRWHSRHLSFLLVRLRSTVFLQWLLSLRYAYLPRVSARDQRRYSRRNRSGIRGGFLESRVFRTMGTALESASKCVEDHGLTILQAPTLILLGQEPRGRTGGGRLRK